MSTPHRSPATLFLPPDAPRANLAIDVGGSLSHSSIVAREYGVARH